MYKGRMKNLEPQQNKTRYKTSDDYSLLSPLMAEQENKREYTEKTVLTIGGGVVSVI